MSTHFVISDLVAAALAARRPVVALETTVVTHGLPQPEGVRVAAQCEDQVAARGAVPATIGVIDGRVRVGLTPAEIERLAAEPEVSKLNLSNLAAELARGGAGSTTVAATLFAAARVGIQVFATGGIGGVHRGEAGDVSVDLLALARYPVAVVSAGAKAVLDLGKTVEMLESLGVPIFGFQTDEFPAFYRRSSGLPVDRRFDDVTTLAQAIRTQFELGLGTGVVVANPIPLEHEMPLELYELALSAALAAASGTRGRDLTPFLLEAMREKSGGKSVSSNVALLLDNARVAADLACALARTP